MNQLSRHFLASVAAVALLSCDRSEKKHEETSSDASSVKNSSSRTEERGDPTIQTNRETNNASASQDLLSGLSQKLTEAESAEEKRDVFQEALLTAAPDEHDAIITVIIDDLKSSRSAELLGEYLEFSEMLEPAVQLPGMVRLLEQAKVLPLQRAAMEQMLRDTLGLTAAEPITSWQEPVNRYLRSQPKLIEE